ncbi:MAG: CcmD family protein [Methanobacteriota archaeon]|nr:MAG: CcmD family protein [Euryarchaeota archaeon]
MKGLGDLYLAYTVVWLGLFGYMVYLHLKQTKLIKEIDNLKGAMGEHGGGE